MARIQITDLNASDSEFMHELTAEELLAINGGSFWRDLNKAFNRALNSGSVGGSNGGSVFGNIFRTVIKFW
jgi:hypothetical protein